MTRIATDAEAGKTTAGERKRVFTTTRQVETAKCPDDEREVAFRDGKTIGLFLRVTKTGSKSWAVQYPRKVDRVRRRVGLGEFPAVTLDEARTRAEEVRRRAARGEDPAADRKRDAEALTFDRLADRWLSDFAERKKVPAAVYDDTLLLKKDVRPAIGGKRVETITKADVKAILKTMTERGAKVRANRCLALIRAIFVWGASDDAELTTANPTKGIAKPNEEVPRDRVLSRDEIRTLWKALDGADMARSIQLAMKLSFVTAQRIGQCLRIAKTELDLSTRGAEMWVIPARREDGKRGTKNGEPMRVPLSALALSLINEALALSGKSPHLFPSPVNNGAEHIGEKAATRALTRTRADLGMQDWTVHDLRRTSATLLADLGISLGTIAHVLDHTSVTKSTVTASVYVKHSFDREKRLALNALSTEVESILSGQSAMAGNVVALRA